MTPPIKWLDLLLIKHVWKLSSFPKYTTFLQEAGCWQCLLQQRGTCNGRIAFACTWKLCLAFCFSYKLVSPFSPPPPFPLMGQWIWVPCKFSQMEEGTVWGEWENKGTSRHQETREKQHTKLNICPKINHQVKQRGPRNHLFQTLNTVLREPKNCMQAQVNVHTSS